MGSLLSAETVIIELLLVVTAVAIVVRRLKVPYTVALVVVGLIITFQQGSQFNLTAELILTLFVPPLIFEAALHIGLDRLRRDILPILTLAVPGVLITTGMVGVLLAAVSGSSIGTALLFGALISATDPVAVVALFRSLNAPRRLVVLVEGESLLNDGTAIVVFNLVLTTVLAAMGAAPQSRSWETELLASVLEFVRVSAVGVGIGLGLGWLASQLIARVDDYFVETTLTTVLAFGSYILAESLHVSGVLAVVGAGVICGNVGSRGMSPTTQIVLYSFWEYMAFLANSLIFLLIGLDVNLPVIITNIVPIAAAVAAVLASRALLAYGLTWLVNLSRHGTIPRSYRDVLFWGGLRGAIGLALALSLPGTLPERDLLRVMAFGVVLFTLLAQGTTMQLLLRRLGLAGAGETALHYERTHGRLMAVRASRDRLERQWRDGLLSPASYEQLSSQLDAEMQVHIDAQRALLDENPSLQEEELNDARREGLRAGRAMLATLQNDGVISDPVYDELVAEVDARLERSQD